jgi:hypothetical protein
MHLVSRTQLLIASSAGLSLHPVSAHGMLVQTDPLMQMHLPTRMNSGGTSFGWLFPSATHWAETPADWLLVLALPFIVSAALAGRWLARNTRRWSPVDRPDQEDR